MKTSVERVDETTVKLSVTVEAERVTEAIDAAAGRLASEVRVPGFRPGRVPRRVLESRLGKEAISQEAARDALPRFYAEALEAEELAAVGQPDLDLDTFEDGSEAVFTATVEVRPDITVPDYTDLQIPHPDWELTEEELTAQLDALRERFSSLETVDRPVRAGDHVLVSISGQRDGQALAEVAADDALYEVNDPEESDSELDRQLLGAQPGAILKFDDTLGPDYGELEGVEVAFTAIVKEVKAKILPDLDDDFAADASEFDTIEELRTEVRDYLAKQKLEQARQSLRGRIVEAVCERVEVPLPSSMVQNELRMRLDQLTQQAEQYGMTFEQFVQAAGLGSEEALARFEEEAKQTVKAQLVVDAVAGEADVEVTREDLRVEVSRHIANMGRDAGEMAQAMQQPEHVNALFNDVRRRKAIDHLVERVEVLSAPPEDVGTEAGEGQATDDAEEAADAGTDAETETDATGE